MLERREFELRVGHVLFSHTGRVERKTDWRVDAPHSALAGRERRMRSDTPSEVQAADGVQVWPMPGGCVLSDHVTDSPLATRPSPLATRTRYYRQ